MQPRGFSKCKGEYMPIIQKNNEIQQEVEKLKKSNHFSRFDHSIVVIEYKEAKITTSLEQAERILKNILS